MRRWTRIVRAVVLVIFSVVSQGQEKGRAVRITPQEIEAELTGEEVRTSGGEDLGKIIVRDDWDNQSRLWGVRTSANITATVYNLTHRWPSE